MKDKEEPNIIKPYSVEENNNFDTIVHEEILENIDTIKDLDELMDVCKNKEDIEEEDTYSVDELSQYIRAIRGFKIMTREEEFDIFSRYIETKSNELREEIITRNLRLVVSIAYRYRSLTSTRYSLLDIISEGNVALLKTIDKFDPTKGYRFITYASWPIRRYMLRNLQSDKDLCRVPVYMIVKIGKLVMAERELKELTSCKVSNNDLAEELGWDELEVHEVKQVIKDVKCISYDVPIVKEFDDGMTVLDEITDTNASVESSIENKERVEIVKEMLKVLTDREREVIIRRFGIGTNKNETLAAIGQDLGMTKENIRRIEAKAIKKLRDRKTAKVLNYLK